MAGGRSRTGFQPVSVAAGYHIVRRVIVCERHLSPHPGPLPSGRGRILHWLSAQLKAVSARRTCRTTEPDARLFPLPVGEGQGGNRLVVRFDTATRTLPEIVELRESSGRAGGFP